MISLPSDHSLEEFRAALSGSDEDIDLGRAALLVAKVEYPDLPMEAYLDNLDALAARTVHKIGGSTKPMDHVAALNAVVIKGLGLKGAHDSYYDPRNSFINDVIDRKVGIPISISIVYMAVGARAGVALGGTSMPMHFLVRVLGVKPPKFVDCYNSGRVSELAECEEALRIMSRGQVGFREDMLDVVPNSAVITRLLTNLKMIYQNTLQYAKALPILDRLLILNPTESGLLRERGIIRYKLGHGNLARQDLQDYLQTTIEAPDADEIKNLLKRIL